MLKQLSRLERTRSLIIVGFVLLMGVSLIFFYAPSPNSATATPARSTEVLARVGRDEVTVGDLAVLKETYQQMLGGQISIAQLGGDRRLLDGLIRDRIIAQEASRLGLLPSDEEVADSIRKRFSDQAGNFIGFSRYKEAVAERYGDIERFEAQMRDAGAAEKLRAFITAGVRISDEEVQEDYKRRNTSFDLTYVPVAADKLAGQLQPSPADLQAFYEQHKEEFRIPIAQKKIRYLFIDQAKVGQRLQIPDAELQAEYDKLSPENKQAGVRVQQIVLKVARPELDAEVRAKAGELVQRARGESGKATEEAFAEIARGNSEDPATARAGGALSNIVKKNANKPDDPLQQTLAMQPGDVSEPIKSGNAYYIFRRGDAVAKTFEDAKQELLVSLRNRRAYAATAQAAAQAVERLRETKDFQQVASSLAAEVNMSPAEMVRETPFIKPSDDVPNIGSSPQFEQAIAPLNNANDVGDRVAIKGGFAIPMLVEKKDPRIPEFDEVRDTVVERVRQEQARSRLEQTARDIAAEANTAGDLRSAAEKRGLQSQTAADYKLGSPLGEAGTSAAADEAIYNLKAGEVSKTPIKIGETWVVVGAAKRTEADLAEFAKQRTELTQTALSARRNAVFEDHIAAVQARMQSDEQIKIDKDVLAKIAEDDLPAATAPQPRFPGIPQPPLAPPPGE